MYHCIRVSGGAPFGERSNIGSVLHVFVFEGNLGQGILEFVVQYSFYLLDVLRVTREKIGQKRRDREIDGEREVEMQFSEVQRLHSGYCTLISGSGWL